MRKLAVCSLQPNKPLCSNCTIHCYAPRQREAIRKVMRFSGPRMVFRNPAVGLAYLTKKFKVMKKEPVV